MSRLGDMIKKERLQRGVQLKPLSKQAGVSVSFLQEVEAGNRIIDTALAQRILKILGASEIMDIEASASYDAPEKAAVSPQPKPAKKAAPAAMQPHTPILPSEPSDSWLDALGGVMKRIPVMEPDGRSTGNRMLPISEGKVEGAAPDKVFYLRCADDSMAGYRIRRGDLLLCVPANVPPGGALMVIEENGLRNPRRVSLKDNAHMEISSFDRTPETRTALIKDITVHGRIIRVEFTL